MLTSRQSHYKSSHPDNRQIEMWKWGHPGWRAEARPSGVGRPRPCHDHGDHQGPRLLKVHERSSTGWRKIIHILVRMWFFDLHHQVTARGGRPVLICEEGDLETQRLNPDNCLTIPHTVDCLQVGGILTLVLTNSSTSTLTELMILLPPRGFSVSFHFSCSPITWRSSSKSTAVISF